MASILVTGGAGFIGSHVVLLLLEAGHSVVVLDNFVNSSQKSLAQVLQLISRDVSSNLKIINGDIRNFNDLRKAFNDSSDEKISAVIHFAGLKSVRESLQDPFRYWGVNFCGTHNLLSVMRENSCKCLVFSSSCTVYGSPTKLPVTEETPIKPNNPYGRSKAAVEMLLADIASNEVEWRIAQLRYFNPVGAHPSGLIGEDPNGVPNNLFPLIGEVATGRRKYLKVFGNDWNTPDGTCVRDYIHVMDLAEGHVSTINTLVNEEPQLLTLNLGTGKGYSVLEVLSAYERCSGQTIPYKIEDRRPGDVAITYSNSKLAEHRLGWRTKYGLQEMCSDAWAWQKNHPNGYF